MVSRMPHRTASNRTWAPWKGAVDPIRRKANPPVTWRESSACPALSDRRILPSDDATANLPVHEPHRPVPPQTSTASSVSAPRSRSALALSLSCPEPSRNRRRRGEKATGARNDLTPRAGTRRSTRAESIAAIPRILTRARPAASLTESALRPALSWIERSLRDAWTWIQPLQVWQRPEPDQISTHSRESEPRSARTEAESTRSPAASRNLIRKASWS